MIEKHILLVDDDIQLAQLIAALLRSHNYKVDIAHTGKEALEKSRENPNLILLDRTLPDIEGLEICRMIRDDRRLQNIPIIILSARDKSSDKIEGLYVGADDYIAKPFDNEELLARIDAVIRRSEFNVRSQEDKKEIIDELKRILNHELITPFYQPIFSLPSLEPLGFEALSRPPVDSLLSNPEFLFKVALSLGMYSELETLCWRKAITEWKKSATKTKLFLNCIPYFFESEQFDKTFLFNIPFDPTCIVLEITERLAIQNYSLFLGKLNVFRNLGVRIAVDDLGSGYASLDTVAEVKPDFVKIDMPLCRGIHTDSLKRNIVESIITFCKKSGIATIAEGIEQENELKVVSDLGVDAAQGYLLSPPAQEINIKPLLNKLT